MSKSIDHIRKLLEKLHYNSATEEEIDELQSLLEASANEEGIVPLLKNDWNESKMVFTEEQIEELAGSILSEIHSRTPSQVLKNKPFNRSWWMAAASVIILLGAGTWFWFSKEKKADPIITATIPDAPPGGEGAILTLADGRQMVLDSISNGVIANQEGSAVTLNNGQLAYRSADGSDGEIAYNTMTTPRGRQFQLLLSDGTRVWLNAASSIKFPTAFAGNTRTVTISGEAYFEVNKRTAKPFIVNIGNKARIEVLGTNFNVNAYENEESIKTTLLTGSVKMVSAGAQTGVILKPAEQGQLENIPGKNKIRVVGDVDLEKVMAWKNGAFNFEGLELKEVLRQLERWYDIDVVYRSSPSPMKYRGGMDRNVKLSDILEVFREMGLKYEWDGKTLTIY